LTFENSYGVGKQALALYDKGDRSIFNNCRFLGFQDTLRSELGRHYFYDSYIEGTVDFIYGKGTAYFENATIYPKSNGYLTAQARENASETSGYVFENATITGSAATGSVYLGRPWASYSRVVFIDSKIGTVIKPAGWSTWSGINHLTTYYAEYNSMDLNGNPLDVSQRVSWSHQLTAAEVGAYSKTNWLGGTDGWNPVIITLSKLTGDYNNDGIVDATDYTVWRDSLSSGATLLNETASIGSIDDADFDAWQTNFGASVTPGLGGISGVPEPTTGILIMSAFLPLVARRLLLTHHTTTLCTSKCRNF
jgi:hypothetical protein